MVRDIESGRNREPQGKRRKTRADFMATFPAHRQMPASGPSSHSAAETPAFYKRFMLALIVLGAFSVAVSFAGRMYGGQIRLGGNTASTQTREVVIADAVLKVPENHMRFAEQRVDGVAARLDLYAIWPEMNGYSTAARPLFENQGETPARLIFLSIEPQVMSRDMSGRYDPIYRQLLEPQPVAGAAPNLEAFLFKPEHSVFGDETLYLSQPDSDGRRFVARCVNDAQTALAPCESDIALPNGLSVKYRFPAELLASFAELEKAVLAFVSRLDASR
jgi:hypothetical protein